MYIDYLSYDPVDGRIYMVGTMAMSDLDLQAEIRPDLVLLAGVSAPNVVDYFVQDDQVVERSHISFELDRSTLRADGKDELTIAGLPQPCVLLLDGEQHTIEDGEVTITSDTVRLMELEFQAWPFRDTKLFLEATL